jgi:hypothetical protein
VRDLETLVNWDNLGNFITRFYNNTSVTTGGVEGENTLIGNVHGGDIEGLEHDLGNLLSLNLGVVEGLSKEDGVLIWVDSKLDVEGMVPDLLHVVPVLNNTVLDGVRDLKDTSLLLSLIAYVLILALLTDDCWDNDSWDTLGSADDGREYSSGSIFT